MEECVLYKKHLKFALPKKPCSTLSYLYAKKEIVAGSLKILNVSTKRLLSTQDHCFYTFRKVLLKNQIKIFLKSLDYLSQRSSRFLANCEVIFVRK